MESGDVGCAATSAQRHSAGSAPGMTALCDLILFTMNLSDNNGDRVLNFAKVV
jgi:hypothetical protein